MLREQLGTRLPRLNDNQRCRLAAKGKGLGRKLLGEICTIVTPDTILRWRRRLIATKYDSSAKWRSLRPRIMQFFSISTLTAQEIRPSPYVLPC